MRIMVVLILGGALALTGCGDSESGGDAGSGGSAGTGGSGGDDGGTPKILEVSWEAEPDCTNGVRSDVVITVIAEDSDTAEEDLIYTGSVGGCDGPINAAVSTINCPNVAPYPGTVMVADPDGNNSAPVAFTVPICADGACTTEPDTCN
jgi:hypothetical protein